MDNTNQNQHTPKSRLQQSESTNERSRKSNKKRKKSGGVFKRVMKVLGSLLLIFVLTGLIMGCFAAVYVTNNIIPNATLMLSNYTPNLSSTISYYDANGNLQELRTLHGEENRVLVSIDEIPEDLINATIAIEDRRFYQHNGVDWLRTGKGVLLMFSGGNIQGGSTLTQQLVKNVTEYDEVTVKRKITEIFTALDLEKRMTKEQIMEWYLNYIYLGEKCNGVYTASYTYFGKHVSELTLAECASLIGITNNPSLYNPYINPEGNKNRQELILSEMLDQKMIDQATYDAAVAQELVFVRGEGETKSGTVYSWYEDYVISDVIESLKEQYDMTTTLAEDTIYNGGLNIIVAYDPAIQAQVDAIYTDRSNLSITSSSGQEIQSSIVIIDNSNGNVVALAGAMGEKTSSRLYSLATDARRSPGSSFKPLSVYAPALELGILTPNSVYDDSPLSITSSGNAYPSNSYGYYTGLMTVSDAVKISSNPVAMRVLQDVTPQVSFNYLTEKLGFGNSLVSQTIINGNVYSDIDYAPLALGGLTNGVTVLEMAAAYSTFPRSGIYIEPHAYLSVTDNDGNVLLENKQEQNIVFSERTTYYINKLLSNVVNVSGGTGTEANFSGMSIAGKTGSTNSNNDRWFVGYTPYYTAAVWVGYDQTQERITTSGNPAARMWKKVMEPIHQNLENKSFTSNVETVSVEYCLDSGLLATEACTHDVRGSRVAVGVYVKGDQPTESCNLHQLIEVCSGDPNEEGYHLAGEFCPPETVSTVAVLNYTHTLTNGNVYTNVRDQSYLNSSIQNAGVCTYHDGTVVEEEITFDPNDPTTWPTDDVNFDINDQSTWPQTNYVPGSEDDNTNDITTPPEDDNSGNSEEPGGNEPSGTSPPDDNTQPDNSQENGSSSETEIGIPIG